MTEHERELERTGGYRVGDVWRFPEGRIMWVVTDMCSGGAAMVRSADEPHDPSVFTLRSDQDVFLASRTDYRPGERVTVECAGIIGVAATGTVNKPTLGRAGEVLVLVDHDDDERIWWAPSDCQPATPCPSCLLAEGHCGGHGTAAPLADERAARYYGDGDCSEESPATACECGAPSLWSGTGQRYVCTADPSHGVAEHVGEQSGEGPMWDLLLEWDEPSKENPGRLQAGT